MPLLRESACDCVHEIICKGMEPTAKTTLIESFVSVLETAGLLKIADVCSCYLPSNSTTYSDYVLSYYCSVSDDIILMLHGKNTVLSPSGV